ncbi:CYTH domain-containing protein [Paracoccus sp. M683]|uniref:CYTH domain-containing protein n=1 Tax=Paracoccus sp. M683 TaxID=2594268 RepID=UPI00117CA33E|nr:CYTH domain-containing protein [Paracoccus sp. M683]TRW95637.1 CYTH domain-containing protein [Paracoccus sp. M683]
MKEIERKFLVDGPVPQGLSAWPILQGYLTTATDSVEIRLRREGDDHSLTLKSDGGLIRDEREITIGSAEFDMLWPATKGRRVEKTRHRGTLPGGQPFELDVFSGDLAPLMLVEVEFPSEEVALSFLPPSWFGKEVTEDKRFKNRALALFRP